MLWMPWNFAIWMMHCPTILVAPFCTIESPACKHHYLEKHQKRKQLGYKIYIYIFKAVPEFKLMKSSSILKAVRGLTVIVAAYSIGDSLLILCQTLWSCTMYVCHVPAEQEYLVPSKKIKQRKEKWATISTPLITFKY